MNESLALSVVMPVHNQQSSIATRIEHLLDELSELTSKIQVVTIDDFSTDATAEVLDDMKRRFPQLDVLRTFEVLGPKAATQLALPQVQGDFVFVQESYEPLDMDGLRQLWELRGDEELVMAQVRTYRNEIDEELLDNWQNLLKPLRRSFIPRCPPQNNRLRHTSPRNALLKGVFKCCDAIRLQSLHPNLRIWKCNVASSPALSKSLAARSH